MSMANRVCQVVRSGTALRASLSIVALQMPRTVAMAHRRGLANLALQVRSPMIAAQRRFAQDVKGQTPQQIEARVLKVCKDFDKLASNADKVTLTASFVKDLGLDSLDRIELMMAFEDEFGFEIPEAEAEKLQTPGDIVKYIVSKK